MIKELRDYISDGNKNDEASLSFDQLRIAVGLLALALVPVLILLGWIETQHLSTAIQPSISDHYHTVLGRNVFVGILCAIGLFFWCYSPYGNGLDQWLGRFAGSCVIITALIRTTPHLSQNPNFAGSDGFDALGIIHIAAAALFFCSLAVYCLIFFVQTKPGGKISATKSRRNRIYRICGWTIVGCLVLIPVISLIPALKAKAGCVPFVFILEAISVFAFAFAWIVKGKLGSSLLMLQQGRLYD
jgi:hypothetical protein